MVQLACILQMVPGWKNTTKLRLFATDCLPNIDSIQRTWTKRLKQLRIECQLELVHWPETEEAEVDIYKADAQLICRHFDRVNRFLREQSGESTLVFLYLPSPPLNKHVNEDYLRHMQHLSDALPPTILVHGLTEVTSDAY